MENKNAKPLPKALPGYVRQQWKRCGKHNCRKPHSLSTRRHGPVMSTTTATNTSHKPARNRERPVVVATPSQFRKRPAYCGRALK
jgi:hypothetical protein